MLAGACYPVALLFDSLGRDLRIAGPGSPWVGGRRGPGEGRRRAGWAGRHRQSDPDPFVA